MSFGNNTENNFMKLLFNATTWANVAINASSSPITDIAVALATSDPGETGTLSTNEVTYTDYAREDVSRTSGGWTVTNNSVSPAAAIDFTVGSGGSGTVTHGSVGMPGGGAAIMFMTGAVTPNIVTGSGVTPRIGIGSTFTID